MPSALPELNPSTGILSHPPERQGRGQGNGAVTPKYRATSNPRNKTKRNRNVSINVYLVPASFSPFPRKAAEVLCRSPREDWLSLPPASDINYFSCVKTIRRRPAAPPGARPTPPLAAGPAGRQAGGGRPGEAERRRPLPAPGQGVLP